MQENKNREYGLFPDSNLAEMLYKDGSAHSQDDHLQSEEYLTNVPDPPPAPDDL